MNAIHMPMLTSSSLNLELTRIDPDIHDTRSIVKTYKLPCAYLGKSRNGYSSSLTAHLPVLSGLLTSLNIFPKIDLTFGIPLIRNINLFNLMYVSVSVLAT